MAAGTLLAAAPVQAQSGGSAPFAGSAERAGSDRVLTAPAAPAEARADVGVRAVSPQVTPAAERVRLVTPGGSYTCSYGRLCAQVWDEAAGKWKVFDFYTCRTYSLSNWIGIGAYANNQTPGTVARFYNSSGAVIRTSIAPDWDTSYNWNPVWKIKPC
ncbi:hypothetical protein ACFXKG_19955 [Streptomyces sp. NPDC059255]|uniref:hypothetical protein n=1 Tax=Streptomyces sp. NPDC059255 TaxID=3346793 RepID=UPI003696855F